MPFSRFPALFPSPSHDIFRLLDDLSSMPSAATKTHRRAFSPNFDLHETPKAYVLEGQLPGLKDKSNVNIEFTNAQTLFISGKIERSNSRTPGDGEHGEQTEIDEEGSGKENTTAGQTGTAVQKESDSGARTKYWLSERIVGEFQRSFSFPGNIDIDAVKASLEHGILKVVVPKKEEARGRKVAIF
ncbi:hypothetical protein RUND412_009747 [Rhizina undulata]